MKPNQPDNGQILPPPPVQGPVSSSTEGRSYLQNKWQRNANDRNKTNGHPCIDNNMNK